MSQLESLKKIAAELSIDIITGSLFDSEIIIKSGHCKVKGKNTIIIDSLLSSQEQSEVIIQALKSLIWNRFTYRHGFVSALNLTILFKIK